MVEASHLPSYGDQPLCEIAKDHGILFGTAVGRHSLRDPRYSAIVSRECSVIVAENEMKWPSLSARRGEYEFGDADALFHYGRVNGKEMRGHTLLWQLPAWAATVGSTDLSEQAELHIRTVAARYHVRSWDVVNEPIEASSGRSDGLRLEPFLSRLGPDYVACALHTAHEVAGSARLCINDFDFEYVGRYFNDRRYALLRLIERLKAQAVPLDGVGLQSHLTAGKYRFSERILRGFLAEIASFGLKIEVTELDVADFALPSSLSVRDRSVADEYERYLTVVLDEPAVDVVVTWGLSDRYTWLNTSGAPAEKQRDDGFPSRPLPFDDGLQRKAAWYAIARALKGAPSRG
jgi:endo-1,4-beta-xylanase